MENDHVNRENIMKAVHLVRRKMCCYDGLRRQKEPHMCDCKYGVNLEEQCLELTNYGTEKTGCPELRYLEGILEYMTDAEFDKIVKRSIKRATPKKATKRGN